MGRLSRGPSIGLQAARVYHALLDGRRVDQRVIRTAGDGWNWPLAVLRA